MHPTRTLDQALACIHHAAIAAATSNRQEIDLAIPAGHWTADELHTLEAARHYYLSRAEGYRDNPKPFGAHCSDPSSWLRWFQAGVFTGTHRHILSQMPQHMRDLLQYCKTAGGVLVAPHPVDADPTPRHLRLETLMRQFEADAPTAKTLRRFLTLLQASPEIVQHYAEDARKRSLPVVWIELHRWATVMLAEEPSSADALQQQVDPYYDDGEPDPDEEPTGGFESVAYHAVPHGDCDVDPLDDDPIVKEIRTTPPPEYAALGKRLYELQRQGKGNKRAWGYRWIVYKSRRDATPPSPALRQTLAVLERATTWPQIATLGRETFGASKRWPSHERKQFWAAYHHRKVELQPSHADHAP